MTETEQAIELAAKIEAVYQHCMVPPTREYLAEMIADYFADRESAAFAQGAEQTHSIMMCALGKHISTLGGWLTSPKKVETELADIEFPQQAQDWLSQREIELTANFEKALKGWEAERSDWQETVAALTRKLADARLKEAKKWFLPVAANSTRDHEYHIEFDSRCNLCRIKRIADIELESASRAAEQGEQS